MAAARDVVIVGGGLQGGLLALAVRRRRPGATVTLVEKAGRVGGNHTWSFHAADVPAAAVPFVRPLVAAAWPGYLVRFPGFARPVGSAYASVTSGRLAEAVEGCGCELRTGVAAVAVAADRVDLADGTVVRGRCVVDARGLGAADPPVEAGFQKFVGLEVETARPWPDRLPTVMDATVPQDDGYRFVYALPFGPRRVLVEDTYFADGPGLDRAAVRKRVEAYLGARGVGPWTVVREEAGVLPMPWAGGGATVAASGPLAAGYAGGWFHPATGYSFPLAVRLALAVADAGPAGARAAAAALAREIAGRQRFARFLNRLLFTAVVPGQRWQVFRRLYRTLPGPVLARFYALEFGPADAARMIIGRPPPLAPSRLFRTPEVRPCRTPTP